MLNDMLRSINTIHIAYGVTDFRKRTTSLCRLIENKFCLNPYSSEAFVFCNKKRNCVRVLCYDKNGFILAEKKLLDMEKMKFQWPKNGSDMKKITKQQLSWLLSGLKIYPDKCFKDIEIDRENIAI